MAALKIFRDPAALCEKYLLHKWIAKSLLLRLLSVSWLFAKQRKQLARISCKISNF